MELKKKKDVHLGDEWQDWNGDSEKFEGSTEAGKRLFLVLSAIVLVIFLSTATFIVYMINPRLVQVSPLLSTASWITLGIIDLFFTVWFFLMIRSALTEKPSLSNFWGKRISINLFIPFATKLGTKFGISKDRLWNSFIKVSNSLIRSTRQKASIERLLILIPRCLNPSYKKDIMKLGKSYDCRIFIVPGGTEARKLVYDYKPEAIIGVACERDLLTGILDLAPKIPVLGIPNKRPKGPCNDCTVEFSQIKDAIEFFVGKR